jgi:hypothetical protein
LPTELKGSQNTGAFPFFGRSSASGIRPSNTWASSHVGNQQLFVAFHLRTNLSEAVAISMLNDMAQCWNEPFAGFSFTKFDGTRITGVGKNH